MNEVRCLCELPQYEDKTNATVEVMRNGRSIQKRTIFAKGLKVTLMVSYGDVIKAVRDELFIELWDRSLPPDTSVLHRLASHPTILTPLSEVEVTKETVVREIINYKPASKDIRSRTPSIKG